MTLVVDFPTPLLTIESARAGVMMAALARMVGTSTFVHQLPNRGRGVCVDGHPSNAKGEKTLAQTRQKIPYVLILCELHLIALVMKEAFQSLCPWAIKGILYTGLAVSIGELMGRFRKCLYDEIRATLHIKWGTPPPSATQFRTRMIKLFMRSASLLSRTMAIMLPNGDWRDPTCVEFYPPMAMQTVFDDVSKDAVAHLLALGLLRAFLPQVLRVFARHHWTGLDISCDQQGALESCHHLFSRTVKRFLATFGTNKPGPARVKLHALDALAGAAPVPLMDDPELADPGAPEFDGNAAAPEHDAGDKDNEDDFVKTKTRRGAKKCLISGRRPSPLCGS